MLSASDNRAYYPGRSLRTFYPGARCILKGRYHSGIGIRPAEQGQLEVKALKPVYIGIVLDLSGEHPVAFVF